MFICCYFSLLSDLFLLLHKAHKSISSPLSPFFSPLVLQSLLPFCALAFHVRSTLIYLCQFLFSFSYVCLCNRLCFMIFSYDSHLIGVICVSCCIFCHTLGGSVVLSNTDAVSLLLWAAAVAARSTCSLPVPAGPLPVPYMAWWPGTDFMHQEQPAGPLVCHVHLKDKFLEGCLGWKIEVWVVSVCN